MNRQYRILAIASVLILLLPILACSPAALLSSKNCSQDQAIPVSEETAQRLEAKIQDQVVKQPGLSFAVEVTEEEVLSYMVLRVPNLPIEEPTIRFTRGQICLAGTFTGICPFKVGASAIAAPQIVDGKLRLEIESVHVGRISVPRGLLNPATETLNATLEEAMTNIQITDVIVQEGTVVVRGEKQPLK